MTAAPAAPQALTPTQALAAKLPLRRKGATFTAVRVTTAHTITDLDSSTHPVQVGDWVILTLSGTPIGHLTAAEFPGIYEVVVEGTLTLTLQDRDLLERTTGVGTTRTAPELIAACQRLARIGIGDVQIPFTPGQLEEIAYRAQKRGITVARAIQDVIDRLSGELFHRPS
jgi:hypothetical protein